MRHVEYIGPRPSRKKKNSLSGTLFLTAALMAIGFISWVWLPGLWAMSANQPTGANASQTITFLDSEDSFDSSLAAAALGRAGKKIDYDASWYEIPYPNGDIPSTKGMAADVLVRSYRVLGHDLQKLVHEDMSQNFRLYPQLWRLTSANTSIDHRRIPNLMRFFQRQGETLPISRNPEDFQVGDIVAWRLSHGANHIGIVVPGPGKYAGQKWIVHNVADGPRWEDGLFSYEIIGHYRYSPKTSLQSIMNQSLDFGKSVFTDIGI